LSGALSFTVFSFFLIYIERYIGFYSIWIIYLLIGFGAFLSMSYLKKLEIKRGSYHNYPHEDFPHDDTAGKEEDYDYEDLGDEYEPFSHRCMYSTKLMNKLDEFSKEKNVKLNMKLIEKAVTFAKKWHDKQMRKTGDHPFYFHPLKVAEMVAERYCKTDVIVAAILHDTVEDSECTVGLIEEKFSARIAQIVDRLTNKRFENGKRIKLSFEKTISRLQKLGDDEALFIKQMDRQHNLETIKGLSPHKQQKMAHETHNYFIKLIAIIGDRLNIHGKMRLENKMFKSCHDILKKKKNDF
jgi:(p)ppGpp synthase/HD superfamily hydrolase